MDNVDTLDHLIELLVDERESRGGDCKVRFNLQIDGDAADRLYTIEESPTLYYDEALGGDVLMFSFKL